MIKPFSPILFNLKKENQKEIIPQILSHEVTVITIQGPIVNNKSIGRVIIDHELETEQIQMLKGGDIYLLPFTDNTKLRFQLNPLFGIFNSQLNNKNVKEDKIFELDVKGGKKGIIIDARGRPLTVFSGREGKKQLISWYESIDLYHKVQSVGNKSRNKKEI